MLKRVLTTTLKAKNYNKVELFQEGTRVRANGNFSLPSVVKEFKTPEEARAFIEGVTWAASYYGIDIAHYMKDMDVSEE